MHAKQGWFRFRLQGLDIGFKVLGDDSSRFWRDV